MGFAHLPYGGKVNTASDPYFHHHNITCSCIPYFYRIWFSGNQNKGLEKILWSPVCLWISCFSAIHLLILIKSPCRLSMVVNYYGLTTKAHQCSEQQSEASCPLFDFAIFVNYNLTSSSASALKSIYNAFIQRLSIIRSIRRGATRCFASRQLLTLTTEYSLTGYTTDVKWNIFWLGWV